MHDLERLQRRATKMLKQCKNLSCENRLKFLNVKQRINLSYENRLKFLNVPTLTYRRCRGDMIEHIRY